MSIPGHGRGLDFVGEGVPERPLNRGSVYHHINQYRERVPSACCGPGASGQSEESLSDTFHLFARTSLSGLLGPFLTVSFAVLSPVLCPHTGVCQAPILRTVLFFIKLSL